MVSFILSQIFGGIALVLVCISFFQNKRCFLILQCASNLFYAGGFFASLSLLAGINTCISIIRTIAIYFYEKNGKTTPYYITLLFFIAYIIVTILFFNGYWDIIPLTTSILITFAMVMKDMLAVNYMLLLPNFLLITYNIFNAFYTSSILNLIGFIVTIIAIIKIYKNRKEDESYKIIRKIAFSKQISKIKFKPK